MGWVRAQSGHSHQSPTVMSARNCAPFGEFSDPQSDGRVTAVHAVLASRKLTAVRFPM